MPQKHNAHAKSPRATMPVANIADGDDALHAAGHSRS